MIKIRVSSKGQVVIPIEVRDRFGIDTGTELELREEDGFITLRRLADDPLDAARGLLRPERPGRSLLRQLLREKQPQALRERSRSRAAAGDGSQSTEAAPRMPTLFDPPTR